MCDVQHNLQKKKIKKKIHLQRIFSSTVPRKNVEKPSTHSTMPMKLSLSRSNARNTRSMSMSSVMSNELCSTSRNLSLSIRSWFLVIVLYMVISDSISTLLTKSETISHFSVSNFEFFLFFFFTMNFFGTQVIHGLLNGLSRNMVWLNRHDIVICFHSHKNKDQI